MESIDNFLMKDFKLLTSEENDLFELFGKDDYLLQYVLEDNKELVFEFGLN